MKIENEKTYFKTMDGNEAAAYISYAFTEVAPIYPITPSSSMAEIVDKFSSFGKKNLFGKEVVVKLMQSESGVAGVMHGCLTAGALATTYTASQGLLLMIPNMYKISGELLPAVIHVSSRTVATHALSILGDHSDVYACRQTGFAMICSNNPQEVMDLAAIAHLSAIKSRIPFLHFFDGFRTSHEIQKIRVIDYKSLNNMLDKNSLNEFRKRSLDPQHPVLRGSTQNDDIFFQVREASNNYYLNVSKIVCEYMKKINAENKTNYSPFNYYGDETATSIIVAMGSVCETIEEVISCLRLKNKKVGLVKVRLYRPFVPKLFLDTIPKSVKIISVLDKTKEPGSCGEPLYLDVIASLQKHQDFLNIKVLRGRYGLSSKNTGPSEIAAVYENMESKNQKKEFSIGIKDDVTFLSLSSKTKFESMNKDITSCKFWGFGSDGTVSAVKNWVKIIGDKTKFNVQGYFSYDSKKSGGLTISHLRFGTSPIKSTYYIERADFVACHNFSYIYKYNMLKDLKTKGSFLLNCKWNLKELNKKLPAEFKRDIFEKKINFFIINACRISEELGLKDKISTILQAAFFKILKFMDINKALEYMKISATNSYIEKGENIVLMNHKAIERGLSDVIKINIPLEWENAEDEKKEFKKVTNFKSKKLLNYVNKIMNPINKYQGSNLAVSEFLDYVDGSLPQGSAAFEKRATSLNAPEWNPNNCIQCNLCSYVCPHAVIRPVVLNEEELKAAPKNFKSADMFGLKDLKFSIVISVEDCTNCGCCVKICPEIKTKGRALTMKPISNQVESQNMFNFAQNLKDKPQVNSKFDRFTVKGSQFFKPLLEFSGACAGCGQTPYAKLVTQLFGENMIIANATGCSSIWAGSLPSTPYTTNNFGNGPAWQNSLFENNAEFGFGIFLGKNSIRNRLLECVEQISTITKNSDIKEVCKNFLKTKDIELQNKEIGKKLVEILLKTNIEQKIFHFKNEILNNKNFLTKKTIWIFGGDGWAYDIGYAGLDHIISCKEDINILVFDTEVYSNTGGQASKATPMGSCAKFSISGKETNKKDLAAIFMNYEHAYVAQVSMGANFNQCIQAIKEAKNYNGPSIIIAYSPCINHGIKGGLSMAQFEEKLAVESGYWNLFRFNPELSKSQRNPFILDSKVISADYDDFINRETRFSYLKKIFPEKAKKFSEKAKELSQKKLERLIEMSKNKNK
ncbi:MAG: pyruvate:ferredoxin (flavodoxin) oxidoreductase [Oscillospiraceae bacterium]|jgi:pyruvate-ferredoxin/flavodoxin oxidoreductase|nr:pyruvate:ferredoxin (flavodoxin) oxidoreductase [Oscillospiraceae bacterium]